MNIRKEDEIEVVQHLGIHCPYIKPSLENNLTFLKRYKIIDSIEEDIRNTLSLIIFKETVSFLKKIYQENKNSHLVNYTILFYTEKDISKILGEIIYNKKVLFKEAPCVFAFIKSKNSMNINMIVIRTYLGHLDEKFFIKYPNLKENKLNHWQYKKENLESINNLLSEITDRYNAR